MFEATMMGRGIDQRNQPKLRDLGQTPEFRRVDQGPHAGRQRNIDLLRNADRARWASRPSISGISPNTIFGTFSVDGLTCDAMATRLCESLR